MKPYRRVAGAKATLRLGGCAMLAAITAGCAGGLGNPFASAPIDPGSPISADVAAATQKARAYPSFNDIPNRPVDQRQPQAWAQAAAEVEAARDKLIIDTAPDTWSLGGTQAFADEAASAAARDTAPNANADTEAFARAARERATPPPSPR